ncbi:hypothetical protein V5799_024366 [Amblyomma americanum]|uniref:Uncharacterized protein n=1 Tax=Amblyomma americanum TaxID=6943 RepID=A0AAQ4ECA4_AMBAM
MVNNVRQAVPQKVACRLFLFLSSCDDVASVAVAMMSLVWLVSRLVAPWASLICHRRIGAGECDVTVSQGMMQTQHSCCLRRWLILLSAARFLAFQTGSPARAAGCGRLTRACDVTMGKGRQNLSVALLLLWVFTLTETQVTLAQQPRKAGRLSRPGVVSKTQQTGIS